MNWKPGMKINRGLDVTMVVYWDEDAIKTIEKHFGVKHIKLRANVGTDLRNRGQSSKFYFAHTFYIGRP